MSNSSLRRIYTRNPNGKKWFGKRPALFTVKAEEVIDDPGVEIVIEALGFQTAAQLPQFRDYFLRAFAQRKIRRDLRQGGAGALRQRDLGRGKKSGQQLRFEACVGGGIPVIRSLSESFAVEEPEAIFGIVNGTCNYILSQMEKSGKPYAEALQRGAEKGYAETNPASDVNGSDAEAKLLLLSLVAFGLQIQPGTTWRKGIEEIHAGGFSLRPTHRREHDQATRRGQARKDRRCRCLSHRSWCRGTTFSPASTARPMRSVLPAKAAAARAARAIAIMFWSVPEPAAVRRRWPCSAMFASSRAAHENSTGVAESHRAGHAKSSTRRRNRRLVLRSLRRQRPRRHCRRYRSRLLAASA